MSAPRARGVTGHWSSPEEQRSAAILGVWLFLATEVLVFGGLFTAYAVLRVVHSDAFREASSHLHVEIAAPNTLVLILSSFTMALAVRSARLRRRRPLALWLATTAALGLAFLGLKAFEYSLEWHERLVPGPGFRYSGAQPDHAELFFWLYFAMTGLHFVHLTLGVVGVLLLAALAVRGLFDGQNHDAVEAAGLYWHFVDVVWLFLLPLLYLFGAGG